MKRYPHFRGEFLCGTPQSVLITEVSLFQECPFKRGSTVSLFPISAPSHPHHHHPHSCLYPQITMEMESLRVLIEQELPTGGTLPVVAIAMGKYDRRALTLTMKDWSEEVLSWQPLFL